MDTALLKSHAVRHSLTFRNLKKARTRQVVLLGDKNTLGAMVLAYKQPTGAIKNIPLKMSGK